MFICIYIFWLAKDCKIWELFEGLLYNVWCRENGQSVYIFCVLGLLLLTCIWQEVFASRFPHRVWLRDRAQYLLNEQYQLLNPSPFEIQIIGVKDVPGPTAGVTVAIQERSPGFPTFFHSDGFIALNPHLPQR